MHMTLNFSFSLMCCFDMTIYNMTISTLMIVFYMSFFTAEVVTIQQICAFELGMFEKSNWCQLFDMEDLLIIDYLIDIRVST